MTEDRRLGDHKAAKNLDQDQAEAAFKRCVIEKANEFYEKYQNMFKEFPNTRERLLHRLNGELEHFRKYPKLVKAMFQGHNLPREL